MKSVVLVEDDPVHERWLQRCIEQVPGAWLAGRAHSLVTASVLLDNIAVSAPAVLMLDLKLGDGSGLDLLPQVRRCWPRTRVLVISQLGDDRHVAQALREGVQGYVVKDGDDTAVVEALHAVLGGLYTLSPAAARHLLGLARMTTAAALALGGSVDEPRPLDLTAREREVLDCLADGLSYEETAGKLALKVSTVQSHVRNLYRKLGASSKVGAVQRARSLGLFGLRV